MLVEFGLGSLAVQYLQDERSYLPGHILHRVRYQHPVYTVAGMKARQRHGEISGVVRTHFCGAYWGNGFHEDGVNSALAVGRAFGVSL